MKNILVGLVLLMAFSVQAEVLCVKNKVKVRNGSVRLGANVKTLPGSTCPDRFRLVKNIGALPAAFAKVAGDGSVLNYGGANIIGVTSVVVAPGRFEITFYGNFDLPTSYDSAANQNLLTVNSSSVADNYGQTNNGVLYASATEITVVVFQWRWDFSNVDDSQAGVNVSVQQGVAL